MKFSSYQALLDLPSWEDNLKERQESLTGVPSSSCLVVVPASTWPRKIRHSKLVVAAMCLAENGECDACLKLLRDI